MGQKFIQPRKASATDKQKKGSDHILIFGEVVLGGPVRSPPPLKSASDSDLVLVI